MSQQSFASLGVSAPVVEALAHHSITTPFPIQSMVIPSGMAGRDVLARSETGSGKTIAFAVPIVERLERGAGGRAGSAGAGPHPGAGGPGGRGDGRPLAEARGMHVAAAYGGVGIKERSGAP